MIQHPPLAPFQEKFAALPHEPLYIAAFLDTPITWYEPLHLDGLLAAAVVMKATNGQGLPPTSEMYNIPLPLQRLWQHPLTQAPLWASTDFASIGESANDTRYWHKRGAKEGTLWRQTKGKPTIMNVRMGEGAYKEYRIPTPTLVADAVSACCVGNQTEIAELLSVLSGIGKKRAHGMGAVREWSIVTIPKFSFQDSDGALLRPVPIQALPMLGTRELLLCGYTPPYRVSVPDAQDLCYPSGTVFSEDIYQSLWAAI